MVKAGQYLLLDSWFIDSYAFDLPSRVLTKPSFDICHGLLLMCYRENVFCMLFYTIHAIFLLGLNVTHSYKLDTHTWFIEYYCICCHMYYFQVLGRTYRNVAKLFYIFPIWFETIFRSLQLGVGLTSVRCHHNNLFSLH